MKYLIVLLLLIAAPCYAEQSFFDQHEVSLNYSFLTKHINESDDVNEQNHIIGLTIDRWSFMTFNNSHYIRSWFLGYRFSTGSIMWENTAFYGKANLYVGALYGYEEYVPDCRGWTVAAGPTIEIGYDRLAIETLIFPFNGGVVVCTIKITM